MRVGILFSRIRLEEKLIVQALEARNVDYEMIDVREAVFDLNDPSPWQQYDVILERCVSHSRAQAALQIAGQVVDHVVDAEAAGVAVEHCESGDQVPSGVPNTMSRMNRSSCKPVAQPARHARG